MPQFSSFLYRGARKPVRDVRAAVGPGCASGGKEGCFGSLRRRGSLGMRGGQFCGLKEGMKA